MKYLSTRDDTLRLSASEAIVKGLSDEGGLLMPVEIPKLSIDELTRLSKLSYQERAQAVMKMYLDEFTVDELKDFTNKGYASPEKFDNPETAPLHVLNKATAFLELWHGPTCAFKDMALQMLPYLLTASLVKTGERKTVCILVATSGDTGKAALEGFCDVDKTKMLVFYPEAGVSDIQKLQMVTQSGNNVSVSAVVGNFDDTQTGVKNIFSDKALAEKLAGEGFFLSSANSINWGRVLPQLVYYVSAYCDMVEKGAIKLGDKLDFCVPTGNFGNILSGYFAKLMGLPVGKLICASNKNNVLTDFIETGIYDRNREFYTTTSPSMDILISSNLERLLYILSGDSAEVGGYMSDLNETGKYKVSEQIKAKVKASFAGGYCSDEEGSAVIADVFKSENYLMDPHTAVAYKVLSDYREKTGSETPCVIVSTASPFKFCDSVLDALGVLEKAEGVGIIDQLTELTGVVAPQPLLDLKNKSPRFKDVCKKSEMTGQVLNMLGLN